MSAANRYLMLARREIWERRSLWVAPVAVAGLLLAAAVVFFVYTVAERMRRSTLVPQPAAVKRRRLDLRA